MEVDWTHAKEGRAQYNETSSKMGTTGKAKQGQTEEHLASISMDGEMKAAGFSWNQLERTAQDRVRWRNVVTGLCSTGD